MKRGLLLSLALGLSASALAQESDDPLRLDHPHAWRFEFRMSTVYYPSIDVGQRALTVSQADGTTVTNGPFDQVFGAQRRLLGEAEVDRDLWQAFGSLGVGLGLAYAEFYGTGFHVAAAGSQAGPTYVASGDGTGFHVGQLRALALYRFDYFVPSGFPLVPYVKVGLDWFYYWNQLSSGRLTPNSSGGGNSQGLVTGVEATLGLSLMLDIIDPIVARDMYRDLGIAHTYLTGGYTWQAAQNGPSDVLHSIVNGGEAGPATLNLSAQFFDFGVQLEF